MINMYDKILHTKYVDTIGFCENLGFIQNKHLLLSFFTSGVSHEISIACQ